MHLALAGLILALSGDALASQSSTAVDAATMDTAAPSAAPQTVSLNSATPDQLAALDQVDQREADAIVALRNGRGGLPSVEALRILDLDEATLQGLRDGTHMELAVVKVAGSKRYGSVSEVLVEFADEPSAQNVQAMAMSYTKTHPELVEGWLRSSRAAYLLPKLNFKYKKELDYDETNRYEEDIDNPGSYLPYDYQDRAYNDDEFEVKLEWRLDKLVISSERIRVINESQDIVKLRDKVLEEVTRLYFDRRRLQVELLLDPPSGLEDQLESELRLQELSANIDAFTGGAFSASLPAR